MVFGVGGLNGAITSLIKSKMVAGGHLGMMVLSRITLVSAGLSCYTSCPRRAGAHCPFPTGCTVGKVWVTCLRPVEFNASGRGLRPCSADSKLLFVPRVCTCFGSRSFAVVPLHLFGTPFLRPFAVVFPLTVFGANSKLSSVTQLSGLLNRPTPPSTLDSVGLSLTLCALQIYLLT